MAENNKKTLTNLRLVDFKETPQVATYRCYAFSFWKKDGHLFAKRDGKIIAETTGLVEFKITLTVYFNKK